MHGAVDNSREEIERASRRRGTRLGTILRGGIGVLIERILQGVLGENHPAAGRLESGDFTPPGGAACDPQPRSTSGLSRNSRLSFLSAS